MRRSLLSLALVCSFFAQPSSSFNFYGVFCPSVSSAVTSRTLAGNLTRPVVPWTPTHTASSLQDQAVEMLQWAKGDRAAAPCQHDAVLSQHIAVSTVARQIENHWSEKQPEMPLTMAFMGKPGLGKTFLLNRLKELIFSGAHVGSGTLSLSGADYANPDNFFEYRRDLTEKIAAQVATCPYSLIIIDEVHLMADGVPAALLDLIGPRQPVEVRGRMVDFRRAIIVLVSNDGGQAIFRRTEQLLAGSRSRSDLQYHDFESEIFRVLNTDDGKLKWLIFKGRIQLAVPFLPMNQPELVAAGEYYMQAYRCSMMERGAVSDITWDSSVLRKVADFVLNGGTYSEAGLANFNGVHMDLLVYREVEEQLAAAKQSGKHSLTAVHVALVGDRITVQLKVAEPPEHSEL